MNIFMKFNFLLIVFYISSTHGAAADKRSYLSGVLSRSEALIERCKSEFDAFYNSISFVGFREAYPIVTFTGFGEREMKYVKIADPETFHKINGKLLEAKSIVCSAQAYLRDSMSVDLSVLDRILINAFDHLNDHLQSFGFLMVMKEKKGIKIAQMYLDSAWYYYFLTRSNCKNPDLIPLKKLQNDAFEREVLESKNKFELRVKKCLIPLAWIVNARLKFLQANADAISEIMLEDSLRLCEDFTRPDNGRLDYVKRTEEEWKALRLQELQADYYGYDDDKGKHHDGFKDREIKLINALNVSLGVYRVD